MKDTIVALATPHGRSGIGVLRLSGASSLEIARKLALDEHFTPDPRKAFLKTIYDFQTGDVIDQAVITYFKSPQSFTGEDVVEISAHGSPVLLRQIVDICLKLDARLAKPGEFSLRALSNGRMNLSQVEAIRDLIDAQTASAARQAVRQMRGELSNSLQPLKDELLNVVVVLESSLEFVEDDLPDVQAERIEKQLNEIEKSITAMASTFSHGRILREGLRIALIGRPNVGKSSLFNSLIGQSRAIVTDIPGTTRDNLDESVSIRGIPIRLTDTAGLRETVDAVEIIGVERTKLIAADADLIVVVLDAAQILSDEDKEVLSLVKDLNTIIAVNKIDLKSDPDFVSELPEDIKKIKVSAKTGTGLNDLQQAIVEPFLSTNSEDSGFLISDARHYDLLVRSAFELSASRRLLKEKASEEIVLVGLHSAVRMLDEITGATTPEDVLTRIFSTFCIGK